ncbi:hypothetical protein [Flavobacterium sp. KACC 22761]|uniref:hypothetical protein n=1 Tax=Flavobacterium sp. KACC 22761 TaxID=3092665 RepID=UPI002A753D73|nr:hypothetical protein [Flavobacterium sp. KACC 22761]WPO80834.1 hypothetical protein SCB73_10665 [Flavobacterium sp. KACC 22761]
MRKIFVFLFISCSLFISCTEENSSSKKNEHNEANFILSKNIERADWGNIQVEETLKFDVKIKNFDGASDVVYVLKPITLDATRHQRNKIDYNFQEEIKMPSTSIFGISKDSILTKKTRDSIILKKANSSFFVSILKPGNFTQQYELRKMKSNKYVAASTQEMLFSAVKIEAYTWNEETRNSTMFRTSQHSRYYEFTVDDGDQTPDTYLTNSESKSNTYTAMYNGKIHSGTIVINNKMTFSDKVDTERAPQTVPNWTLTELKIVQKRDHEPDNIITYNNLSINQK